ncbi:MAG: hypothetical protein HKN36_12140 [Hellea sp.]|nr:hypothetical protein [Hellea sp.]
MSDSFQNSSVSYARRRSTRLPSMRRHLLGGLLILGTAAAATVFSFRFFGNPDDAIATGEVVIEPAPLPAAADTLNANGQALPDLLDGQVPIGSNPTVNIDALGNPVQAGNSSQLAGSEIPGTQPRETLASIQTVGPKTILIDGKPLGGSTGSFPTSALPRAPFADITRNNPFGQAPTVSSAGRKAVTSYARPFTPTAGKKQVSIIIGGLGIDRNLTRRIINETPPEVTMSFAAHTNGLQTWVHQARDRGHEVIIELPMEGTNFNASEPGASRTLKSDVSAAVNIRNLDWLMSRALGYFAVTNYQGEKLLARNDAVAPILDHLSDSGLGLIYDGSSFSQTIAAQSRAADLPYQTAFNIIDSNSDIAVISSELSRLETASLSGPPQIGFGFALPETLVSVKQWVASLDAKGLELAPASFILNQ